ncbi:MAG: hypothetical protein GZ085_08255 [Sulfuriferula multivorans]|uniref:MSHA biogenesis protein MshP n=1 Tax=Sulfuriferula multivorans TaxID=1559896 RepID=A0A7C9P5H3_9PROT|nr:hypothetical protein [Sulfuriferula multivorans]
MMPRPIQMLVSKRELRRPSTQAGFVLPTAIFLVVILAALGGYMVTLARTSNISSGLDIQGARAYQAARAGIEWAAFQVVDPLNPPPSSPPFPPPTPCPVSPTTVAAPGPTALAGTLSSFTVVVKCDYFPETDGATNVAVYQVTSTATSGAIGSVDRVVRQIQGSFGK